MKKVKLENAMYFLCDEETSKIIKIVYKQYKRLEKIMTPEQTIYGINTELVYDNKRIELTALKSGDIYPGNDYFINRNI